MLCSKQVITEERGLTLDKVQLGMLGTAKKVSLEAIQVILGTLDWMQVPN